jgi:hypothetical protein
LQFCYTINLIFKEEIMFNFMKKAVTATQEVTASTTQATFKDIRPLWKALAKERKITKEDIAALCIYRAMVKGEVPEGAKTRLQRAFKPITNTTKLGNGARPYGALESAVWSIKYSKFAEWLDKDELAALLEAAKKTKDAGLR